MAQVLANDPSHTIYHARRGTDGTQQSACKARARARTRHAPVILLPSPSRLVPPSTPSARPMRSNVVIPAQSPKLTRAPRRGVSQGIPLHPTSAVSGPPPAALPCLGLPSTSGGPIHPHSTLTQAYCEGLVRIGLPGEQTTTTSRLPPRCIVLAGHGYVHQSTRLGAPLLATPQYSQHPRCCRRRSPELRACVNMRLQRSSEWPQEPDPRTRQSITLLPIPNRLASRPARMPRAATNAGKDDTEREIGRQLAGGSDLGRAGVAPCAHKASAGWGRLAADWTFASEGKTGWGAVRLNTLFTVDMRDVALWGWHDVGGECSVVPPECTEIRSCVTHALGAGWREGCGTRATTASPHG